MQLTAGLDVLRNDLHRLGARIAEIRRARTMSQEDLAERAGVDTSYVARIEAGSRTPALPVIGRIADALEVPVARLVAEDRGPDSRYGGSRELDRLLELAHDLPARDLALLLSFAERLIRGPAREPPPGPMGHARGAARRPRRGRGE